MGFVRVLTFSVGLVHSGDDIEIRLLAVHERVDVAHVGDSGCKSYIGPTADRTAVHVVPCYGYSVVRS